MLMKTENRRESLMRKSEQCDSLLLTSSKAGNALCGVKKCDEPLSCRY
jgi:hypothetical protein